MHWLAGIVTRAPAQPNEDVHVAGSIRRGCRTTRIGNAIARAIMSGRGHEVCPAIWNSLHAIPWLFSLRQMRAGTGARQVFTGRGSGSQESSELAKPSS